MPSLLDDPEAYAFAAQIAEDRRRKLTNQQALNAILQGVGDLPYTLLGAPVEISTGLLRAGGMAQGEQAGGIDYFKRKATELGIRPPDSDNPTMRDMRMGAEIAMGGVDPTRVARAGGAVAGAVAREAKPIIGDALENYMAKSGLAPRVAPEGGLLGGKAFDVSKTDASDIFGAGAEKVIYKDPNSGGYIQVLTRPNQPASVTALEVPEAFRKQGIGGSLQEQALKDFPNMQGQVSSKSAARSAYKQGRRPVGQPDATLDDVLKMIDDDSSVNLVSPTRQQEMSGAQGGLLSATPVNDVADTLIYHGTSPSAAKSIEKAGFDVAQAADGTIWFTTNPAIGEVAATAKGAVVSRSLNESNLKLATWDDIDKYSVDELINMGYDGVKMPSGNETTYQIFNPEKLTKLSNKPAAPQAEALKTAQKNAALPVEKGGLGLPKDNTPMDRAKAMGGKDMVHFSRSGGDYTELDSGKFAVAPFDAVGTHVGSPQAAMDRFRNTTATTDQIKGTTYPVTILGDRPLMNQNGMPWGEDDLNAFLRKEGGHTLSDVNGAKMTYQDMNTELRKKLFEEQGYSYIPYFNEVEGKGSISYIVPPKNIRSQFAAFDPMRKNESNILAGALPFGILGADEETKKDMQSLLGY